jgi:hypothetical protein
MLHPDRLFFNANEQVSAGSTEEHIKHTSTQHRNIAAEPEILDFVNYIFQNTLSTGWL